MGHNFVFNRNVFLMNFSKSSRDSSRLRLKPKYKYSSRRTGSNITPGAFQFSHGIFFHASLFSISPSLLKYMEILPMILKKSNAEKHSQFDDIHILEMSKRIRFNVCDVSNGKIKNRK